jgi:hypothetical protein
MPSFSKEFREDLRLERIYFDKKDLLKSAKEYPETIPTMLNKTEEDILEEEHRLNCAIAQVKESKANLKRLAKKKELLTKVQNEQGNC